MTQPDTGQTISGDQLIERVREALSLPADASERQVFAALDTHILRRAVAVGVPASANLAQVVEAEKAVAASAVAAAEQRRVAASQMLGHRPFEDEPLHPALRSTSTSRVPRNTSKSIDYDRIIADLDSPDA